MDIAELDVNAVCFGILCNFPQFCGEERAKEAAELVRALYAERETLRADLARVTAERDGYKSYYNDLSSKPDCNTCEKRDCEYRPRVGGIVRANCPLYSGPEKED